MDIPSTKKNRAQLKGFFVKNAIPTESNFSDLIEGSMNQRDDGLVKTQGAPLSIEAGGDDNSQKRVLALYNNFRDPQPLAVMNLAPFETPNNPATKVNGLGISDASGNTKVFIDPVGGRLGLGTLKPTAGLDVRTGPQNTWFSAGPGGEGGRIKMSTAKGGSTQLMVCDKNKAGRLRFKNIGTGTEDAPQFTSWIGMSNATSPNLTIMAGGGPGGVGIGTKNIPAGIRLMVYGSVYSLMTSVNNGANTGVDRGIRLWNHGDTNHAIYSANPRGKSPAGKTAARGHWDANHRLRLRTARAQGFLFENQAETALVDIDSDNGNLWAKGNILAGGSLTAAGSDIYFTQTNHAHTGIGNTKGHAAIENASSYKCLMILGRNEGTKRSTDRVVGVWDRLHVHGRMFVDFRGNPGYEHGTNALTVQTKHGYGTFGARNGKWFHMSTDRPKFYFHKPAHAKGGFHTYSKRSTKKDIRYLGAQDEAAISERAFTMPMVRFKHADDDLNDRDHIGVIVEEAPADVVEDGGESINMYDYSSLAMIATRALRREVETLRAEVERLLVPGTSQTKEV